MLCHNSLLNKFVSFEKELYIMNALVYACSICTDSAVLTRDPHFKELDNVRFLD